jgi:sugar lactone lactonase YvrE
VAGHGGTSGFVNAQGGAARFDYPIGLAVDSAGNIYVADEGNQAIRKIDTAGNVTTYAGNGVIGSADGVGTAAQFYYPNGVALDSAGNVYVSDSYNCTIRKIDTAQNVTTLAGSPGVFGSTDGIGSVARFYYVSSIALDKAGNIYVTDEDNETIRRLDTAGNVTTLAGTPGVHGTADGVGPAAGFWIPYGITVDNAGNIFVADSQNSRITKGTAVVAFSLTAKLSGTSLTLSWTGGTLQSSSNAAGAYADVVGATSPYIVTPSAPQQFYRTRH